MIDIEKQKRFQKDIAEENEKLAFNELVEVEFLHITTASTDVAIEKQKALMDSDILIADLMREKLTNLKASGNMPYKERKDLEEKIRQTEDAIAGSQEAIEGVYTDGKLVRHGFKTMKQLALNKIKERETLAKRYLEIAKVASEFIIKEEK